MCFFEFLLECPFFFLGMLVLNVGVLGKTRQPSVGMCLRCVDGYTPDCAGEMTRLGERFLWSDRSPVSAGKCYWAAPSAWICYPSFLLLMCLPALRCSFWSDFLSSPLGVWCTYAYILPSAYFSAQLLTPISLVSKRQRLHSGSFYSTRPIYSWYSHRLTNTTAIPTTTTSHSHRSWSWSFLLRT